MGNLAHVLRGLLGVAVLLGLFLGIGALVPMLSRAYPGPGYSDMRSIGDDTGYFYDATVGLERLAPGDLCVYTPTSGGGGQVAFAQVVARPGESLAIANGQLLVEGRPSPFGDAPRHEADRAAIDIPVGHVFVVSTGHKYDSFAYGPIPAAIILGRYDGEN